MEEERRNFEKVFSENADSIFRYCFLRVSDRETAKDLAQSAFLKTWDHISRKGEIQNPKAFLYKVARNLVIDYYRSQKADSLESLYEEGSFDPAAPEEDFDARRIADASLALKLLNKLPKEHKEIIILRYVEDLSFKEIGEIIGETENAAAVRFHRAIKKARNLFEPK